MSRLLKSLGRGVGGASLGSALSAGLGLARDALILRALGVSTIADRYFLTFLSSQLIFLLLLGGTRFVELQGMLARRPVSSERARRRKLWASAVRGRATVGALLSGTLGLALAETAGLPFREAALIGLLVAAAVWVRSKAEYRTLFVQADGVFGWASFSVAGQNFGVVLGALAGLMVAEGASVLIWAGVMLGYGLHWLLILLYRRRAGTVLVQPTEAEAEAEATIPPITRALNMHLLVTQLPLVAEQAALNVVGTGVGALIGVARRFTGAINSIFLVPLGNLILVRAARSRGSAEFTKQAWSALYLLGLCSIGASLSLFFMLAAFPGVVTAALRIEEASWVVLLMATAVAIPSATFQAAHAVLARGSHAMGRAGGPLRTASAATAIHGVGIGAVLLGAEPLIALGGAAVGWGIAAQFEGRRFQGMYGPASRELRLAFLPITIGMVIAAVLAAGVAAGLASLRGSLPLGVAAVAGLIVMSFWGARAAIRAGDLGWL